VAGPSRGLARLDARPDEVVAVMTGGKAILRSMIAAVGVVALVATSVSYRHAF